MFRKLKKEMMEAVGAVDDTKQAGTLSDRNNSGLAAADATAAVAQMMSGGASTLVEINIKARGLPNYDVLSKSDAMAVIFAADGPKQKNWAEVGRTDTVANSLAPEFRKPVRAAYSFERLQPMRLVIYDVDQREKDNRKLKLDHQDFLAQGQFLLSDLLTAAGQRLSLPLSDKHGRPLPGCGAVLIAEQVPNTNAVVELCLAASKLENKDSWGKSDPFLRISKLRSSTHEWVPVVKSEVVDNNLSPTWKPLRVAMSQLCSCDPERPLLLEVFDHDIDGSHDLIGRIETSLAKLQAAAAGGHALTLINPKKQSKPGYVSSGTLVVKGVSVTPRPSFLDYVRGGLEVSFLVAVDFTASNGDPRDPASLHHYSQRPSIYEDAISSIGAVLEHYDTDRRFPAFGFGAELSGTVSHCFPLNGSPGSPEVAGVAGILQAYRHTLSTVRLSGPTLFAPLIKTAAQIASQPAPRLKYSVLLILTDGCIMDMAATLQAVVDASALPLSLLIVGVGDADFGAMEALDGDKKKLKAPNGRKAERDCVQFCELRPHKRDTVEGLATKLLAELPGQVVQYFHDMRRTPPPPPPPMAPTASAAPPPPAAAGYGAPTPHPGSGYPGAAPAAGSAFPPAAPATGAGYPPAAPTASAYPPAAPPSAPGYPPAAPSAAPGYPPAQASAGSGYPPAAPPAGAGYPPAAPPAASGYPPAAPPAAGGYPPAAPPAGAGYPPAAPPAAGGYPPGAPPSAGGYPHATQHDNGYPPAAAPAAPAYPPSAPHAGSGYPPAAPAASHGYPAHAAPPPHSAPADGWMGATAAPSNAYPAPAAYPPPAPGAYPGSYPSV